MRTRSPIALTAVLGALSLAVVPALATEGPAPAALEAAPPVSVLQQTLNKCRDSTLPRAVYSARNARATAKTGFLRGKASDTVCGVALVTVSMARAHGKRCEYLSAAGRLGREMPCKHDRWLVATSTAPGTGKWRLQLPKGLPGGKYLVRTRAVDFAGNVQRPRTQRLKLG